MAWWLSLSEVLRNFGILAAGVFGLWIAYQRVRAANRQAEAQIQQADAQIRQAELARREHVADLFNRTVGQLQDAKLEIRLGSIYTLGQVCSDFQDLSQPVIQLLTAYLRENPKDYGDDAPPIDVQEIMALLGKHLRDGQ